MVTLLRFQRVHCIANSMWSNGRSSLIPLEGMIPKMLTAMKARKSSGVEVSWSIRSFSSKENTNECNMFVKDLANGVAQSVLDAGAVGSNVLYKAYLSKNMAGRMKYLGHGLLNMLTKSTRILVRVSIDSPRTLLTEACWSVY